MRWKKVPGQGDIEDRRGQSSGPLGGGGLPIPMGVGGGGLGLVIVVVLALLFGGNILGGGGSDGPLSPGGVDETVPPASSGAAPGDVIFFGSRGPASKPSEIGHMGIYVGNGWFVHSSSGGVTLQPLEGWYATTLAWARRPLAESGLA